MPKLNIEPDKKLYDPDLFFIYDNFYKAESNNKESTNTHKASPNLKGIKSLEDKPQLSGDITKQIF